MPSLGLALGLPYGRAASPAASPVIISITLRKTTGLFSSYPDNYKLYSGATLLVSSDWDGTTDLVWDGVLVPSSGTLRLLWTENETEANSTYIVSLADNTCGAVLAVTPPYSLPAVVFDLLTSIDTSGSVRVNVGGNYSP